MGETYFNKGYMYMQNETYIAFDQPLFIYYCALLVVSHFFDNLASPAAFALNNERI